MSKINAVRLINLNYNNNAIRISDECFHFNGESTLLSLRNGGGKSVLVQMMTAPFVHKRYRDAKDRPFESYFTTNKPSFILVEWALDQGAGYVLTGMMVRRSQDTGESNNENLDMINIISEYQTSCLQDIHHLPVVEKGKKEMVLRNFTACRQLFENYKKDKTLKFFYYDMTNAAQSRQYFDKLMEYQINYKEWETIIKKVNLKESGLSDLFSDCRDEKGLVEKWFLDAVESKLNKDRNRIKEFQSILGKYVGQYKDNQSKIKRRDIIRSFKEEAVEIEKKAVVYQQAGAEQDSQENLIAHFLQELGVLQDDAQREHQDILRQIDQIRESAARVEYERLSSEIYGLMDRQSFHTSNRDMIEMEQENLEREAERIQQKLYLLSCAKQQEFVEEEGTELEAVRQKLVVSRKKDEDLEPERKCLGVTLKCHYEGSLKTNGEKQEQNQAEHIRMTEEIAQEKEKSSALEESIRTLISRAGALGSRVEAYDKQEEQYNVRYGEELIRNILGDYEPGMLEIRRQSYEQQMQETIRERLRKKKLMESSGESQRRVERRLEDMRGERIRTELERSQQEKLSSEYERELEERRTILKYLDLEERQMFDTEKILHASGRKLTEIAGLRRNLEKEEDNLQKEYQRLTQGKVLELPGDLEAELKNMGIHIVYGMEWLKKNGYTEKQNRELVRHHPFLPYALILSAKELEKLSQNTGDIYTSFPVPLIVREQLENKEQETDRGMVRFPGVSFYVLFNENLLNEEKLRLLVQEKEHQIERIQESIRIRQKEYEEYFARQEILKGQSVTKEGYARNQELLKTLAEKLSELDRKIREASAELSELKNTIEELRTAIQTAERETEHHRQRLEDFDRLFKAYGEYRENRNELDKCRKEEKRLLEKQKLSRERQEKLQETLRTLETERDGLVREQQKLQEHYQKYAKYEPADLPEDAANRKADPALSPEQMEARYDAITASLSQELQDLEAQEQKTAKRYQAASDELERLRRKYRLKAGAWKETRYDQKEESHQETLLEDRKQKVETKKMLWNQEDKQIAVISQQIRDITKRINSECGQEHPLPKAEIQSQDFEARKNQLRYEEKETQKLADKVRIRLQSYEENLTALSEYSDLPLGDEVQWEEDFSGMNSTELRKFKGILIRDYNQKIRSRQEAKDALVQLLNKIVRMEAFQESFYKKPLEAMLELSGDASRVLLQLQTTIQSYDSLMEKLEVDISLVEKEKNRIVELMDDYILEVHRNLGRIDHNSTITIHGRPVKMLKIQLPDWEENSSMYQLRLEDFIDEVTQKGIGIFERNENAQEYFGTQVTTKNLYDRVIGIGNVQIRLYKIEEQREYPITWAEVARNSGGEGFLSAFVILSSLLYYMRKDDTDIFADRNEGKVLLMDNPFAQTNAAHLLKPLMDMAKKTNTQLICLTGLGGESIYNRFDNIYVLNLIAASLRHGMQYLKGDHLRGNDPETIVVSQIEVTEQQELLF